MPKFNDLLKNASLFLSVAVILGTVIFYYGNNRNVAHHYYLLTVNGKDLTLGERSVDINSELASIYSPEENMYFLKLKYLAVRENFISVHISEQKTNIFELTEKGVIDDTPILLNSDCSAYRLLEPEVWKAKIIVKDFIAKVDIYSEMDSTPEEILNIYCNLIKK
jgi:hypothetical protein